MRLLLACVVVSLVAVMLSIALFTPKALRLDVECYGLESAELEKTHRRLHEADRPVVDQIIVELGEVEMRQTLRCRRFVNGQVTIFDAKEWWVRRRE